MFNDGLAYASVFATVITFALVASYLPSWVAAVTAGIVFYYIVSSYEGERTSAQEGEGD